MPGREPSKKQIIYKLLRIQKKKAPSKPIDMVKMHKKAGCSLPYLSMTLRSAREAGYVGLDDAGNHIIKKLPKWETFNERTTEKSREYRKNPTPTSKIPKEFVVDENTILTVVKHILNENKELKEKNEKLMRYVKKLKGMQGSTKKKKRKKALEETNELP